MVQISWWQARFDSKMTGNLLPRPKYFNVIIFILFLLLILFYFYFIFTFNFTFFQKKMLDLDIWTPATALFHRFSVARWMDNDITGHAQQNHLRKRVIKIHHTLLLSIIMTNRWCRDWTPRLFDFLLFSKIDDAIASQQKEEKKKTRTCNKKVYTYIE